MKTSALQRLSWFGIPLLLLWLSSCTAPADIQSGSYRALYDFESRDLHPEYVVYHFSPDSTRIWFRIQSAELLYARSGAGAPFASSVRVQVLVSDASGIPRDTVSVDMRDNPRTGPGWLIGSLDMPLPAGRWNMLIEFTDITKNLTQSHYLSSDKSSTLCAHYFLLKNYETGEPVFTGFASPGQMIEVESAVNGSNPDLRIMQLNAEVKLPPPPFSTNLPEMPSLTGARSIPVLQEEKTFRFIAEKSSYFITADPLQKQGIMLKIGDEFYPEIKTSDALQWPMRYICTKSELDEITKNVYPKKLIDNFWLECGGNRDQARDLIRIYYHRVQEANYYFSSYTEGWRTDRGMIHMIFGNPTKVSKYPDSEIWQYGEDGSPGLLSFVFRKSENPFSGNVYILDRDPMYRDAWERMVQAWRNGRVYVE